MASLRDWGYEEIKTIGRGQYGVVQLVRNVEDKMLYVCKTVDLTCRPRAEREAAKQEVGLLKRLHHPNIVEYKDSFFRGDAIIIAMQYCEGGDLSGYIRDIAKRRMRIKESTIMSYLVQVLQALQYVHGERILHRDLKSSNLFLTDKGSTIKLGDFGISRVLESTAQAAMSVVGTPHYMSPEVCENRPYNHKSDIWALGCVVYELCMLKHPFAAGNLLGLVHKIVREKFEPIPPMYSAGLNHLVQRMLLKGANARPSVANLLEDRHVSNFMQSQAGFSPTKSRGTWCSLSSTDLRATHTGGGQTWEAGRGAVDMEQLTNPLESSQEVSIMEGVATNAAELRIDAPKPSAAWPSPTTRNPSSPLLGATAALLEDSEEYEEYEDDFCSEDEESDSDPELDEEENDGAIPPASMEQASPPTTEAPPLSVTTPVPCVPADEEQGPPAGPEKALPTLTCETLAPRRSLPAAGVVATRQDAGGVASSGSRAQPSAAPPEEAAAQSAGSRAQSPGSALARRTVVGRRLPAQGTSIPPRSLGRGTSSDWRSATGRARPGRGVADRACRASFRT